MKSSLNTSYHKDRIEWADRLYKEEFKLPHRYVFILTNRCNLRCSFCFQEKGRIEGSLNTEDWLDVVSQLPSYGHVTLTGGEPFVFKGFETVFNKITEKLSCNLISNGLLLNEQKIDLLLSKNNFKVLSISIDDIGNKIRGVPPKNWGESEKMMQLFIEKRNLLASKSLLDAKTVILDENAEDLFEIYKYCRNFLKTDTHSFMFLKGHPIQHADLMFPMDKMKSASKAYRYSKFSTILQQLELVRKYNISNGLSSFVHPKFIDLNSSKEINFEKLQYINSTDHDPSLFEKCKAPWASVHINVDGNLFPCMAIKMGNVKEQSLSSIIKGNRFDYFKKVIKDCGTVDGCNRCGYLLKRQD